MELNVITTEEEEDAALKEVGRLFELDRNPSGIAHLENLANLLEASEDKNYAVPKPNIKSRLSSFFESRRFFHR